MIAAAIATQPQVHAQVHRSGTIAHVTIGDGSCANALSQQQWGELAAVATQLGADHEVRMVVFRGAGATFCAGFRIDEWRGATEADVDASFGAMEAALQAVEAIPVPTLAVVQGVAAGAGCQLALACDLRVATSSARLGMPILRLGILCSPAFALRLSAVCGVARAKELLFTGRLVAAPEAAGYGLLTQVVGDAALDITVTDLASTLAGQPRSGLLAAKFAAGIGLQSLLSAHDTPAWRCSDPAEFPARIGRFLDRSGK